MTVKELIEKLQKMPQDAKVVLLTSNETEDLGVLQLNKRGQVELEGR